MFRNVTMPIINLVWHSDSQGSRYGTGRVWMAVFQHVKQSVRQTWGVRCAQPLLHVNLAASPCLSCALVFQQMGEQLICKLNPTSDLVKKQLGQLRDQWQTLKLTAATQTRALGGAKNLQEFNKKVDKLEAWIKEKVEKTILLPFCCYTMCKKSI